MSNSPLAGASTRLLASARSDQTARSIIDAAQDLLGHLAAGRRIDSNAIRTAMQSAFGASDASGAWDWKTAYEAVEVAQLLFMRRYGPAIHARTADPFERLKLVERIARLAPTQTRRSEEMVQYQQFSTPLGFAWVAGFAAALQPGELVLEPSAGTGLLAIQAELGGAQLALNEVADTRFALLKAMFDGASITGHDAAQIHDRLEPSLSLLGLGIFGPGIANGIVSGGPQLGAGAAAGTALLAGGAASGVVAGARMAGGAVASAASNVAHGTSRAAGGATMAYALGSAGKSGASAVGSGMAAVGDAAVGAATSPLRKAGDGMKQSFREGSRAAITNTGGTITPGPNTPPTPSADADQGQPAWAKAMKDRQTIAHGATIAAHTLKSGDSHGGGASIDTSEKD